MRNKMVLIRALTDAEKTEYGGLIILLDDPEEKSKAKVLAKGPDVEDLEVGDVVAINPAGMPITVDNIECKITDEKTILGVF